mgnify:CR=1 FL=1
MEMYLALPHLYVYKFIYCITTLISGTLLLIILSALVAFKRDSKISKHFFFSDECTNSCCTIRMTAVLIMSEALCRFMTNSCAALCLQDNLFAYRLFLRYGKGCTAGTKTGQILHDMVESKYLK